MDLFQLGRDMNDLMDDAVTEEMFVDRHELYWKATRLYVSGRISPAEFIQKVDTIKDDKYELIMERIKSQPRDTGSKYE